MNFRDYVRAQLPPPLTRYARVHRPSYVRYLQTHAAVLARVHAQQARGELKALQVCDAGGWWPVFERERARVASELERMSSCARWRSNALDDAALQRLLPFSSAREESAFAGSEAAGSAQE